MTSLRMMAWGWAQKLRRPRFLEGKRGLRAVLLAVLLSHPFLVLVYDDGYEYAHDHARLGSEGQEAGGTELADRLRE